MPIFTRSVRNFGGQPPKPIRLMIGILLLQHLHNLSDEQVVRTWLDKSEAIATHSKELIKFVSKTLTGNFSVATTSMQWNFPIDPSSLTRFRNRIGANRIEKILSLTIFVAVKSEVVKVKDLKKVIVDTTVMPKKIKFPTDLQLYKKARERLVKLTTNNGIAIRQNYNLIAKTLLRKISGYHGVESDPLRNHTKIFISEQRKGLTKSLKKQLKRRSAIESMIGHMKHEGKLWLCRSKGLLAIN